MRIPIYEWVGAQQEKYKSLLGDNVAENERHNLHERDSFGLSG